MNLVKLYKKTKNNSIEKIKDFVNTRTLQTNDTTK